MKDSVRKVSPRNKWLISLQKEAMDRFNARIFAFKIQIDYVSVYQDCIGIYEDLVNLERVYEKPEERVITETIVMFNFLNGNGNYPEVDRWAKEKYLRNSNPFIIHASGKKFSILSKMFFLKKINFIETTGFVLNNKWPVSACLKFNESESDLKLEWKGNLGESHNDFFIYHV